MKSQNYDIEQYAEKVPQYYDQKIPELLRKYLVKKKYKALLDCGCGDGALIYSLKNEKLLNAQSTYAIDLSQKRINLVKEMNPEIKAYKDDAETLKNIPTNSIDFFVSTQVIEHVDHKKMADSIDRVTRKGAIVYISTVFKKSWGWYFYRYRGKWVLDPTHVREYQKDEELTSLFKNKFKLLENTKELIWFSLGGFLLPRLKVKDRRLNLFSKIIKKIKMPVPGYYYWEIVFQKK